MKELLDRIEKLVEENTRLKVELEMFTGQGYEVNKLVPYDHSPFIRHTPTFPVNPIWCSDMELPLSLIPNNFFPTTGTTIKFTG